MNTKQKNEPQIESVIFSKEKEGIKFGGEILPEIVLEHVKLNPAALRVLVAEALESMVNRARSSSVSWKDLVGDDAMDATEWFIAYLDGRGSGTGRFKGNEEDRKQATELLELLTKSGRVESWEAQHGIPCNIQNLTRLFTKLREEAAAETARKAAALRKIMLE